MLYIMYALHLLHISTHFLREPVKVEEKSLWKIFSTPNSTQIYGPQSTVTPPVYELWIQFVYFHIIVWPHNRLLQTENSPITSRNEWESSGTLSVIIRPHPESLITTKVISRLTTSLFTDNIYCLHSWRGENSGLEGWVGENYCVWNKLNCNL